MNEYIAFLRGINVGGNNLIKMIELKACFEAQGFENVATYIQSGNVLFSSDESDVAKLTLKVEDALAAAFNYKARVVLRSYKQMKDTVAKAPKGFGSDPVTYKYEFIFLKEPLTSAEVMKDIPIKEGVDVAIPGDGVVYFSRVAGRATQSRLGRVVAMPMYQNMTIRNWNTTNKLLNLMEAARTNK